LRFVFLPGMDLLMNPQGKRGQLARLVLDQPAGLGIPVIDVRDAFRTHAAASLFFYPDSHYNETGAGLVANAVLSSMDRAPSSRGLRSAAAGLSPKPPNPCRKLSGPSACSQ
ncbi:MAG TPA: hypothetical protein VGS58_05675, partial [Candidatus Sulfopaludibacter sp.]|nr:hypothetical protein [Candidatus Sulfopaludibacter sp.]